MQGSYAYVAEAAENIQHALEQMPFRYSYIARRMVREHLPTPETTAEIDRYVHHLLTRG